MRELVYFRMKNSWAAQLFFILKPKYVIYVVWPNSEHTKYMRLDRH